MKIKLTKTAIDRIPAPATGRITVHDTATPGLCVRISANDSRTFYTCRWKDGKVVWVKLGPVGEITVDQAVALAKSANADIRTNDNPNEKKRAAREASTLGDMWNTYHTTVKKGARTMKEDEGLWRRYLAHLAPRRVQDITQDMVQRLHDSIAAGKLAKKVKDPNGKERTINGGATAAVRTVSLLSGIYTACSKTYGMGGSNPAQGIRTGEKVECDRFLSVDEMPAFWTAMKVQSVLTQDVFKTAIYTAQRRATILAMRWDEVNLRFATWTIPAAKMKNRKALTVPLVPQAVELLTRRQKAAGEGEWVFASPKSATGFLKEPDKALKAIVKAAGISPLTMHDLRRTTATWMNDTSASFPTIAALLAHHVPQITGIYAKATADTVRKALVNAVNAMVTAAETPAATKAA